MLELGPEGDDRILDKLSAEPRWKEVPALAYASRTLVGWSLFSALDNHLPWSKLAAAAQ